MPKPRDGQHEQSRYPGICRRFSTRYGWQWGYRLKVGEKWTHVHESPSLEEARAAAQIFLKSATSHAKQRADGPRPTLADLLRRYLATQTEGKPRVDADRALRRFAAVVTTDARLLTTEDWLGLLERHGFQVEQVRKANLSDFVNARREAGAANASINRECNFINAALHRAEDWYEALEQWKPPKIPRLPVDRNTGKRLISDAEYTRLLAWLGHPGRYLDERGHQPEGRKHVYWILRALMLTGTRVGELYKLKWSDVDLSANPPILTIRATKTAKKRASVRPVVITSDLRAVLEAQRPFAAERQYIFTKGGNHSPKYYKIIRRACEAMGIPYGRETVNGLLLRFARHTTATELLRAGMPIGQVGRLLGNDPKTMLRHYDGIAPLDDARALEALEKIEKRRLGSNPEKIYQSFVKGEGQPT